MKRELERAIKRAGSVKALAGELGLSASTVSRWRRKGVPRRGLGRELLKNWQKRQRRFAREKTAYLRKFREMQIEATVQGRWPARARTRKVLVSGPVAEGEKYILGLNAMITPKVLKRIEAWAKKLKGNRPFWQARSRTSQYAIPEGPDAFTEFKGYQTVRTVEQMSMPESGDFGVDILLATHKTSKKNVAVKRLISDLSDLLQYPPYLAYVHSVELWNYKRRTEQERKAWQTKERYKRRHKKSR